MGGGQDPPGVRLHPFLQQAFVYVSAYMCACALECTSLHTCVTVCVFGHVRVLLLCPGVGGGRIPPDAFAPRTRSGVSGDSRWAITVGTYIAPQGKATGPNDETHQSSSLPGLTCPSILFMVAYPQ